MVYANCVITLKGEMGPEHTILLVVKEGKYVIDPDSVQGLTSFQLSDLSEKISEAFNELLATRAEGGGRVLVFGNRDTDPDKESRKNK